MPRKPRKLFVLDSMASQFRSQPSQIQGGAGKLRMLANKLCAAEAVNTTNFDTSDDSEHTWRM